MPVLNLAAHHAACDAQERNLAQLQGPSTTDPVYRASLRKAIHRLLNDVDMPGKEAIAGRAWMESQTRSTADLERLKARTLERLAERRGHQQAA